VTGTARRAGIPGDTRPRSGVRELWLVDLEGLDLGERGVEALALERGTWRPAGWFTEGTTVVSPLLPGLAIPVDDVLRDPRDA
jgi:Uma2 family endonuclease